MTIIARVKQANWRGLLIPGLFVAAWSIASWLNWVNPKLIPAPLEVLDTAWRNIIEIEFWKSIAASLGRDLSGFTIGALFGVAFGIVVGISKIANYLFSPSFNFLRQVSLFAWLPLISTFLEYGNSAKILFISLSVFYPVALHTIDGVRGISNKQFEVAQVYQFNHWQLLTKLILPGAAPQIFVGLQLGLIFAWLATIGSEFLLANYGIGLGNIVIRGRATLDVSLIVFGLVVIGIIGIGLNHLALRLERWLLAWRQ
ncbi:taurine ABC transporter permease [Acinetobacter sp. ANC 4558]|uniref:ABC transporter permease n=1 Tax=Acinetobacter sp. ANC 4558 TaxID=1977876 RepID=UPI000A34628F|nr:ABC transporter permease [Acinetobacter sp. ANC 4558]OTG84196.1 taurine ABC transporter permease [Acinetobacter sp. ANC 4558]